MAYKALVNAGSYVLDNNDLEIKPNLIRAAGAHHSLFNEKNTHICLILSVTVFSVIQ